MTEIALAILGGFAILGLLFHAHAWRDRQVKIENYRATRNLVEEFHTLRLITQRLLDMATAEKEQRLEAARTAEYDRRRQAAAELEQAVADGRARRLDG